MIEKMPMIESQSLYKYTKICKTSVENLINNQLYFSSPLDFNDPYEFVFQFFVSENCYDEFLSLIYQGGENQFSDFSMGKEEILDYSRNCYLEEIRAELGVYCLSKNKNSDLMWAHYGDCHRGICIEYDQTKYPFSIFLPINYTDKIHRVTVNNVKRFEMNVATIFKNTLLRKSKWWSYEKEYRYVLPAGTKLNYSNECIKSITFGFYSDADSRKKIIKATSHLNTKYYEVTRSINKYEISRQPITG